MSKKYTPTNWVANKTVATADAMNNIEKGIEDAHQDIEILDSQIKDIENEVDVNGLKVHFIKRNDSKSDCILIQTNESNTLIDVGWEIMSTNLVNYLESKDINKIHKLIITHYHDDHVGGLNAEGLSSLMNSSIDFSDCIVYLPHKDIDYSRFVDNVGNGISDRISKTNNAVLDIINSKGLAIKYPTENEILKLSDKSELRFLNCDSTYLSQYYNETLSNIDIEQGYTCYNNFSLVCELTHLNKKFLFSGDIEVKAQELLLNSISSNIDVYKVEHHGVNKSTYKDYLYKINPKIAVIQNRSTIGLKDKMTTTYLFNRGCKIYDNNNSGDVIITSNGLNLKVKSLGESKIDIGHSYCGQPYDLKRGLAIKNEQNLNDYINTGVYYSETTDITNSLINKPVNCSGGFKLVVQSRQTDTSPIQIIIDANANIFIRLYKSNVWTEWKELQSMSSAMINVRIGAGHTTTTTEPEKLNLNTVSTQYGEGLTLNNGSVIVGAGISRVRISGQVGWSSSSDGTNVLEGYIYKNSSSVVRNGITAINTYFGVPLASKIIDVSEGDTISLYARTRTQSGATVSSTIDSTWLSVESV